MNGPPRATTEDKLGDGTVDREMLWKAPFRDKIQMQKLPSHSSGIADLAISDQPPDIPESASTETWLGHCQSATADVRSGRHA